MLLFLWFIPIAFLAAVAWIWFGRRPTAERFATAQGIVIDEASLPLVRASLRRTYVGRITGALAGAIGLGALGWALGTIVALPYLALLGLIAGTMVGIALAQHQRRQTGETVRHASLTARTVADYAPEHAMWSIAIAAIVCVGLPVMILITAPAGMGPYAGIAVVAAAAVVVVPLGWVLQRRVVEAPRGDASPVVDDALRRTAVGAVHHAVLGVLCCGIVLAGLAGALTYNTFVVKSEGHIVFRAPPGTTSISVDTGLRQTLDPAAPARVFWIEADGTERVRDLPVAEGPVTSSHNGPGAGAALLGWFGLFVAGAAITQWSRATRAWRRVERSQPTTSPIAMPGGPAGSAA